MEHRETSAKIDCSCGETLDVQAAVAGDDDLGANTVKCSCGAVYSLTVTQSSPPDE